MSTTSTIWVVDVTTSAILVSLNPTNNPSNDQPHDIGNLTIATLTLANSALDTFSRHGFVTVLADKFYNHQPDTSLLAYQSTQSTITQSLSTHNTVALPNKVVNLYTLLSHGLIKLVASDDYPYPCYRYNGQLFWLMPYRTVIGSIDTLHAHAISHALQLARWHHDHRFCSHCGNPSHPHDSEYASVCHQCHHRSYPRISPCVIVAITRLCPDTQQPQILLARHHRHQDGMYGLIAGFMEIGESLESAVRREVLEEVGLTLKDIRYVLSQPWPYPSNLMLGFVATYDSGEIVIEPSELSHAQFFDLDKLPKIPPQGTIAKTLIDWVSYHSNHSLTTLF